MINLKNNLAKSIQPDTIKTTKLFKCNKLLTMKSNKNIALRKTKKVFNILLIVNN